MKTNNIKLVMRFEGFRARAYKCPAGVWTIGYGHTGGVSPLDQVTWREAKDLLRKDLRKAEQAIQSLVKVKLNQDQHDALASFVYNVGEGAFRDSTLLKLLNRGEYLRAANQFKRWNMAGGRVLGGLERRREAEANLFIGVHPD